MWAGLVGQVLEAFVAAFGMGRQRRTRPDSKKHPVRKIILDLILDRPGVRHDEVWKFAHVSRNTARHHLTIMARSGLIQKVLVRNVTAYFPNGHSSDMVAHALLMRAPRAMDVAALIAGHPNISQQELTSTLGVSRKVFRRGADMLVKNGLVEERRDGKKRRYEATTRLQDIFLTQANGSASGVSSEKKSAEDVPDAAS